VAIALSITTMNWTEHRAATGNKRLERFSPSFLDAEHRRGMTPRSNLR
jgi:hypothetical protein